MFLALFSQYLTKINIPVPMYSKERGLCIGRFPLFRLFPVSIGGFVMTKLKKNEISNDTIFEFLIY